MARDVAEILYLNRPPKNKPVYSPPFKAVMRIWERTAIELDNAFKQESMGKAGQQAQRDIEATYEEAGREQREALEALAMLDANKIDDILAKLELWKATACPTLETAEHLSLTDKVLLSAYHDLKRILVHS